MKKMILFILLACNLLFAQSWTEVLSDTASDGTSSSDLFGRAVSISGNYAIVGAYGESEDASGNNTLNVAGSAYIYELSGGVWTFMQKIVADDRAESDRFGYAVSISGNYAVVGAYLEDEDTAGSDSLGSAGSAYIFELDEGTSTWSQQQKIVASDRGESDYFGHSVSISGNYIIVGADYEDEDASGDNTISNAGSAYIFKLNEGTDTWEEKQKIVTPDRAASDYFGSAVGISSNYAIVGAYGEDEDAEGDNTLSTAGSAYIFKLDEGTGTWGEAQKIAAPERAVNDRFGSSVSISGNYIIVGAYNEGEDAEEDNTLNSAGSAYIFELDEGTGTWGELQKIVSSDRTGYDYFGFSVYISGNYAVSGAYGEDEDAEGDNTVNGAGSAYIFKLDEGTDTWSEDQKIVASDRSTNSAFGSAVSISEGNVIVGGPNKFIGSNFMAGSVYIYSNPEATPVELTSFDGIYDGSEVELSWETATEVNNYGFEVERKVHSAESIAWSNIGFVEGHGTVNTAYSYSFVDSTLPSVDTVSYRLKQVDLDGSYEYSKVVDVVINNSSVTGVEDGDLPSEFGLSQNYPNPFNPTTSIEYSVSSSENVSIKVYNMLGQEVMTLVNEVKSPGTYNVKMDGSNLASGVYIYRMAAGSFSSVKKFVLMK